MAAGQEHFALDWIKGELLETLNGAREALEAYVESDRDETRMRACLTGLHQVHGTLVMLELKGVTLLADHLERLSQAMLKGEVDAESAASQTLMQGILELPGHIEEIQQGQPDSEQNVLKLVNEARAQLGEAPLGDVAPGAGASEASLSRFADIDGIEKVRKIRAAYQQVLLSLLKGESLSGSASMLSKVAQGLERVCEDTPHALQWQAFREFVTSLGGAEGPLPADAVKLLRRIDSEIRALAQDGALVLRKPVSTELIAQLIAACEQRGHSSPRLVKLKGALAQNSDDDGGGLVISGRQALASAAAALREELTLVKDQLDLSVRAEHGAPEDLVSLIAPLKQIGSTLSLLGFESSKTVVSDQVEILNQVSEGHALDQPTLLAVASALVQVDENLASFTQGGKGEAEQITDDAARAVTVEARQGLDQVKQSIVDYITSKWDTAHLEQTPTQLASICGALDMIPLPRASRLLASCGGYVEEALIGGSDAPGWEALDHLADAISGIDYYLERLNEESSIGTEDILELVERSLLALGVSAPAPESPAAVVEAAVPEPTPQEEEAPAPTELAAEPVEDVPEAEAPVELGGPEQLLELDEDREPEEPKLEMDDDPGFDLDNVAFGDEAEEVAPAQADVQQADEPAEEEPLELAGGLPDRPAGIAPAPEPESASEPAVASAAPAATTAVSPSLADSFESDAEIVEIFVEEVDEVLETIAEWLPQWREELDHEEALTEVRRAFHTLKGSGRIVGANIIGELAWSVENMLNRVIDGTFGATAQFVTVVDEARALVPALRDAFEAQEAPAMESLGALMERADVLASGGTVDEGGPEAAAEDAAVAPETGDEAAQPEASADAPETDLTTADDSLKVFLNEAAAHLAALESALHEGGVALNEDSVRALHTLAGSAGMAGIDSVASLARPFYELATVLRQDQATVLVEAEAGDALRAAISALAVTLDDLEAGREPADHAALISNAEALRELGEADPELAARAAARDRLLGLEGLSVVMEAPAFLRSWYDGAMDLGYSERLCEALTEVAGAARELERTPIAELAEALGGVHVALADERLTDDALTVLDQGHDRLLGLFDALAADQELTGVADVVADLLALPTLLAEQDDAVGEEDLAALGVADEPAETLESLGFKKPEPSREALGEIEELAAGEAETPAVETPVAEAQAGDGPADAGNVVAFPGDGAPEEPGDTADDEEPREISLDQLSEDFLQELKDEADAAPPRPDPAFSEAPAEPVVPANPPAEEHARPAVAENAAEAPLDPAIAALLPEDLDEEIVEVFFEEADEILESLDENVHQWTGEPGNRLYLEHMLRGLHTLKGGARLAGLIKLGDVTHQIESFLIEVQSSEGDVEGNFFKELAQRFDELSSLTALIKGALAGEAVSLPASLAPPAEQEMAPELPPTPTVEETPEPEPPPMVEAAPAPPPAAEPDDKAEPRGAQDKGDQRSSQEMVRVGSGLLEELVNLAGESSIVRARIEQGMSDFTSALDEMETTIERVREQLRRLEIETEAQILFRQDRPDGPSYDQFDPLEMDRYSQLQQLSRGLSESASDMLDLKETLLFKARESETLLLQQARINTELQEGLMRTRMVPFSRLLPRLRRIVRQVSGELDKSVEFHAFNAEGELDRNLLERMVPPLEHMLRNAVDHGIESKELRKNFGKPATGRIDLRLSREGGDVVIEISDDGAGIDVESVRAKAVERGLMAEGAKLRDDEICQFVLAPGFSTAKSVTQISGRGVGMDVVHSEVKQLGGSIQIASRQGKGSRFIVRVPFTVSVNRALMVSVGDDAYAIPLNTIEGIVLLSPQELEKLYAPDGNTFEYAGIPYRVRYLGHYLGREFRAAALQSSVPVVLVRSGDHAVAVHVDGVQGSREIVVKSLGPQFAGVGGISGATILGDGSVVVILDLLALIRAQSSGNLSGKRPLAASSRTRCVMVVDDSVTVRKVTSRLLERQGMDVLVAKDGIEAISLLQERRPDVMLLDIEMPRMDGFEVARQVRHDDRLSDLPIIMISSRTGEKHQEHAAQLGVNSFLGKPFQENELLATIERLVN